MSSQKPSGSIVTWNRADNKIYGVAKTGGDATLRGALRSTCIPDVSALVLNKFNFAEGCARAIERVVMYVAVAPPCVATHGRRDANKRPSCRGINCLYTNTGDSGTITWP